MADDRSADAPDASGPEGDDPVPPVVLPSREALPPPPQVNFTRPSLPSGLSPRPEVKPYKSSAAGDPDNTGDTGRHGAGMASGTTFAVSIVAGAVAGNWIDTHWIHAQTPWATVVMTLLGVVVGFTNMMRLLSRSDRNRK